MATTCAPISLRHQRTKSGALLVCSRLEYLPSAKATPWNPLDSPPTSIPTTLRLARLAAMASSLADTATRAFACPSVYAIVRSNAQTGFFHRSGCVAVFQHSEIAIERKEPDARSPGIVVCIGAHIEFKKPGDPRHGRKSDRMDALHGEGNDSEPRLAIE